MANDPPRCFTCKQIITFDNEHIGKNGRKVPLDPATHAPHDCPMREKKTFVRQEESRDEFAQWNNEEKDDHGNELVGQTINDTANEDATTRFGYVDHTAKGQSKVKIFAEPTHEGLEESYNLFLKANHGKIKVQGGQFYTTGFGGTFAIALYYEEVTA